MDVEASSETLRSVFQTTYQHTQEDGIPNNKVILSSNLTGKMFVGRISLHVILSKRQFTGVGE